MFDDVRRYSSQPQSEGAQARLPFDRSQQSQNDCPIFDDEQSVQSLHVTVQMPWMSSPFWSTQIAPFLHSSGPKHVAPTFG